MRTVLDWINRYKSVFVLGIAGLSLLLAQSAFWLNQTIFDQQTFTGITKSVLDKEESRTAIAKSIVDKALEDRPVLQRTIGDQATQMVTGFLNTDLVRQSVSTIIDRSYVYLTSPNREEIAFDLTSIKEPLSGIISFAEQRGREVKFDPEAIPDKVVLFNPEDLPDIYGYSVKMLWIGPLFWLISLGLLGTYIYRGRRVLAKRVYIVGGVIIAVSCLGLLTGPLLPPPLTAQVRAVELRGIVEDLIRAFLSPFIMQMLWTICITVVALVIFNQRFAIIGLLQKVTPKTPAQTKGAKTKSKR